MLLFSVVLLFFNFICPCLMRPKSGFLVSGDTKAQVFHPYQVVGSCMEIKLPGNLFNASVHGFSQPADGLHPAKAFFDPFSDSLADAVVRMSGGSAING